MKKYICNKCGYITEEDEYNEEYVCPICSAKSDEFKLIEDDGLADGEIDAVIESVVEEVMDEAESGIVNTVEEDKKIRISDTNPSITRILEKCINCGQCKKTCEKIVNLRYDLNKCEEPICLGCGQCILNCPTGALVPKYAYKEVKQIMDANEKIVVAIISPAVRVSIGEAFGLEPGINFIRCKRSK